MFRKKMFGGLCVLLCCSLVLAVPVIDPHRSIHSNHRVPSSSSSSSSSFSAIQQSTAVEVSPNSESEAIKQHTPHLVLPPLPAAKPRSGIINVHIVPHTHDDVGWLKTIDQYFAGKNESIQHASVHQIISSVMDSLSKDPNRKFVYVEMAFFWRWWRQQTDETKQKVRNFVKSGQLEFINGGWCMHDEATTHFQSMIDQTTEGHTFIKDNFNVTPTVQWQIDPFGHSSANAELSVQMGLSSLFFARADYQDYYQRLSEKAMELMWSPSQSLPQLKLFTHIMYQHYGPPPGFDWDVDSNDEPMQDDAALGDYNVQSRLADFLNDCTDRASHFQSSNIMLTMGSDFNHRQSEDWFGNLDKLIKYSNMYLNSSLNVFYSTPSIYAKAVQKEVSSFPQKSDDFFPYGDGLHAYWTGYFTSRPALKRYERYSMAYLQACKQIEADSSSTDASFELREAMGVNQHHDAVSGTEKQHVAFDYAKRLAGGVATCETMMNQELAASANLPTTTFSACHLLNVSVCAQTANKTSGVSVMLVYNSLAVSRTEYVRIPVASAQGAAVKSSSGDVVSQVIANTPDTMRLGALEGGIANTGAYTLVFQVSIPARGLSVYSLNFDSPSTHPYVHAAEMKKVQQGDYTLVNDFLQLNFSSKTGRLTSVSNLAENLQANVDQQFLQYFSSVGNALDGQRSGAYIFRPNQQTADPITRTVNIISYVQGPLVQQITQDFGSNITQTVRLYADQQYAEFEWTVGPIGCHDGWGKEIVSRFSSNIASDQTFYTDSNGREMQKRVLNHQDTYTVVVTEPVAQNYYPVNTAMYIQDAQSRLTVVTDRSQAGTSLDDGQIELMVHRRTVQDDSRGVGEPIADPGVDGNGLIVRGTHYLIFASPKTSPGLHKTTGQHTTYWPVLSFSEPSSSPTALAAPSSGMRGEFPAGAHLLTLQSLAQDRSVFLVRVNHLFQVGEGDSASQLTVSLDSLFPQNTITSVTELMLSGNQPTPTQDTSVQASFTVTLNPMQIRTFHVEI